MIKVLRLLALGLLGALLVVGCAKEVAVEDLPPEVTDAPNTPAGPDAVATESVTTGASAAADAAATGAPAAPADGTAAPAPAPAAAPAPAPAPADAGH